MSSTAPGASPPRNPPLGSRTEPSSRTPAEHQSPADQAANGSHAKATLGKIQGKAAWKVSQNEGKAKADPLHGDPARSSKTAYNQYAKFTPVSNAGPLWQAAATELAEYATLVRVSGTSACAYDSHMEVAHSLMFVRSLSMIPACMPIRDPLPPHPPPPCLGGSGIRMSFYGGCPHFMSPNAEGCLHQFLQATHATQLLHWLLLDTCVYAVEGVGSVPRA